MVTKNKLKAIDFFSGAGGLTHGLKVAGIDVIAGIDNDGTCKETFEKNNAGAIFLEKDITKYLPADLELDLKIKRNADDMIFAGCAPCQFWSIIRTSKEKSKKTKNLILDFQKFIEYFKPGFVVVENVPGISSKREAPWVALSPLLKVLATMWRTILLICLCTASHKKDDASPYWLPEFRQLPCLNPQKK